MADAGLALALWKQAIPAAQGWTLAAPELVQKARSGPGALAAADQARAARIAAERKAAAAPAAPAPRLRGPQGTQQHIAAAFAAMDRDGAINPAAGMTAHFAELRRRMMAAQPGAGYSDRRPSDETLRKTVRELFPVKSKG